VHLLVFLISDLVSLKLEATEEEMLQIVQRDYKYYTRKQTTSKLKLKPT
jgi:hypothetical protein